MARLRSIPPSRPLPPGAPLALVAWLCACAHDWDRWEPAATGAGAGGTTGSSSSSTGTGGSHVQGECPQGLGGSPLVKVELLDSLVCIDATEVRRGQYADWLAGPNADPELPASCATDPDHVPAADWPPNGVALGNPVVHVDWCDALAYCTAQGKRLCGATATTSATGGGNVEPADRTDATRDEWFAACTDGGQHAYPYGNDYDADACNGSEAGKGATVAVGSLGSCKTSAGVADLSGNVWEWEAACDGSGGPADSCTIRGGGFNNYEADLMCAVIDPKGRDQTGVNIGFRCCAEPALTQ